MTGLEPEAEAAVSRSKSRPTTADICIAIALHVICWWGLRIVGARWMALVLFADTPLQAAEWWWARLLRAAAIFILVAGWAKWRRLSWQEIGLGGAQFGRNFAAGLGGMIVLGVLLGEAAHLTWKPAWSEAVALLAVLLVCLIDVLGQQMAVFGILQSPAVARPGWATTAAFLTAWVSFGAAHVLINPVAVVALAWIVGALFAFAAWRSKNLGLGAGIHFGYYVLLVVFVGEIRMW